MQELVCRTKANGRWFKVVRLGVGEEMKCYDKWFGDRVRAPTAAQLFARVSSPSWAKLKPTRKAFEYEYAIVDDEIEVNEFGPVSP